MTYTNQCFTTFGVELRRPWASHKSYVRKDGDDQDGEDFKGKPRRNETHASRTDADAMLYCKGNTVSKLRYKGRTLRIPKPTSPWVPKRGYDAKESIEALTDMKVTP